MPLIDIVAENLRVQRRVAGLTQEELARKARISVSYVSMLERGQRSPPIDTIEVLARALRITPASLLDIRDR